MACLLTKGPVAVILYGWTPDPDEIENPDLSVLEGVVCRQFQKLSAGAFSGFDAIPIPFIKHACLPVRCDGKFKQVNVLVPLMARLFRVLCLRVKCLRAGRSPS